jgi:hypothetical protein
MNFPASGYGVSSKYFDDLLLLDGTYQIISISVHSTSRDEDNTNGDTILRAGLLLVPSTTYDGYYEPVSTASGKLNGGSPTQYMKDIVILARKTYIDKTFILRYTRERTITPASRIVPAYLSCTIFSNKVFYNNKSLLAITNAQWQECQRINLVPPGTKIYYPTNETLRALDYKRKETFVSYQNLFRS